MLKDFMLEEIDEEMGRVTSLYPEFKEARAMIRKLYTVRSHLIKKHPYLQNRENSLPTWEEVKDNFLSSKPLHLKGDLDLELFTQILALLGKELRAYQPLLKEGFIALILFIKEDLAKEEALTCHTLFSSLEKMASKTTLSQDLITLSISFTLTSFYSLYYQDFLVSLDTSLWDRGSCPVCDQKPHYGLLRPQDGAKILECWLCTTRWKFLRLQCPFCGNTDQEKLGYFQPDVNQIICRVHYCEDCNSYHKIFDLREYDREHALLSIHHLATLSLDLLARREGFRSGSGLEWVNQEELHTLER